MKLNDKMIKMLNDQMNLEYNSAWLYRSLAVWAADNNFDGSHKWLKIQAAEEVSHAEKFYNYLLEKGEKPEFKDLEGSSKDYSKLVDIFKAALEHEYLITSEIKKLFKEARDEEDYETEKFLDWFIHEQVEEEANFTEIVEKLELCGDNVGALFMYDNVLGHRE